MVADKRNAVICSVRMRPHSCQLPCLAMFLTAEQVVVRVITTTLVIQSMSMVGRYKSPVLSVVVSAFTFLGQFTEPVIILRINQFMFCTMDFKTSPFWQNVKNGAGVLSTGLLDKYSRAF